MTGDRARARAGRDLPLAAGIVFANFILLGIPIGMLGVAWPSIRRTFALPQDALGVLLLVHTVGSVAASFVSGRFQAILGRAAYLAVSSAVMGLGFVWVAVAPTWQAMLVALFIAGIGFGGLNAGLNTYAATHHGSRLMNWLHASFAGGATLSPIALTALLVAGHSWRWGYAIAGGLQIVFTGVFLITRSHWRDGTHEQDRAARAASKAVRWRDTLALPLVWLGIAVFLMSTSVQAAAGQWNYTFFTEARGVEVVTAGAWSGYYWAAIMLGRVLFGFVGERIALGTLLRWTMVVLVAGAALMWSNLLDEVSFFGLALMGFAVAPQYPLLVLVLPRQLGASHAPNAIGFQIAAGGLGAAIGPWLAGVLVERVNLEVIGPFLLLNAVLLLALYEVSRRLS
ncbi:MAG: MFS transporter [Anaerolineae bacterium]